MREDVVTATTVEVIRQFNDAFNKQDVDGVMSLMTNDCVFENTYPPPDGEHYEGQEAVRAFWKDFFHSTPHAVFQAEEMFACENRCVVRWVFNWGNDEGNKGHVRGVDVYRVQNGKVAEKFAYVKG